MANYPQSIYRAAISRLPQTNYLTTTTVAAGAFREQVLRGPALMNAVPTSNSNKGQTTGNRFGTERWIDAWSSGGGWDFDLTSQNAGRYLYAAFGNYSVAAVVGSSGAYKHTFLPLDTSVSAQLPSYTIVNQVGAGIDSSFPSMVASGFSISAEGTGRVGGSVSWIGSGDEDLTSGVTWATHVTSTQGTENLFWHTQSTILVDEDDNGGGGFTTCELLRWNFGISNSFADGDYGCPRFKVTGERESGALRSHLLLTDSAFDYGFTLRLRADDPAYALLIAQTPTQIVTTLEGGAIGATVTNHKIDITMPLAHYESAERGFDNGFAVINVRPDPLYDTATSQIVKVELYNNIASYAV